MNQLTFKEACSALADLYEGNPDAWCAHKMAADDKDNMVMSSSPDASRWCLIGGLHVLDPGNWSKITLDGAAQRLGYCDAVDANNVGGREVAIQVLRIAAGEVA